MRLLVALWLLWPIAAHAAPMVNDAGRPWAAGVAAAQQKQALALFTAGNVYFEESRHVEALAHYRSALESWDHPAIRYNMAVCLIHLDQPLAAYENLVAALRFDAAPFSTELYAQALTYKKLLDGQLSHLRLSSGEAGAEVFLDGERLFVAPGAVERLLKPGPHQAVARKPRFLTETQALMLLPGATSTVDLRLLPLTVAMRTERRFAVWKPWLVFGAGIAVAVAGTGLLIDAKRTYDSYDAAVATSCASACMTNSPVAQLLASQRTRGDSEQAASYVLFGLGGAAALAGVALLIANQPREVERQVSLLPSLGAGGGGLVLTVRN